MEWERREVELERSLAKMEAQQREIAGAASQVRLDNVVMDHVVTL